MAVIRIPRVFAFLVAAGIAIGAYYVTSDLRHSDKGLNAADVIEPGWSRSPDAVEITAPQIAFTLPEEPTTTPLSESVQGVTVTGTSWVVETNELFLDVLLLRYPGATAESLQAGVDEMVKGMATRAHGTVTSDATVTGSTGPQRRVVIAVDGGNLFSVIVTTGDSIVVMSSPGEHETPPPVFEEMVASLALPAPS